MPEYNYGYRFLLVGLIVGMNGFFAAAEVSLLSSRRSRLQQLADDGDSGAKAALELLDNPGRLLSVGQIGVTLCSLGLGWAGEETIHSLFTALLHPLIGAIPGGVVDIVSVVLAFAVMTYMHVVIGEVVPKNIGIETADRFAVLVAPILVVIGKLASPLVKVIDGSSMRISRMLGLKGEIESGGHSVEELKFIISSSRKEGEIERFHEAAMQKLLDLEKYSASEIMVPRNSMISVPESATLEQLLVAFNEHQFSRLPVYETSPDQIIGIVHLKDLVQVLMQRQGARFRLHNVMRPPILVPETKSLADLIDVFRANHTHMAIVVDEHGSTTGAVTLEDVLEQVFGEIEDEHDISRPKPDAAAVSVEVEGNINVPDLANQFGIALPTDGGYETLAGFLLSKIGDLPATGASIEHDGRRYVVSEMARNRIAKVRIDKLA
ncbi:MAG: HlyC/CorC family transporter [Acidobacteria bacterium]|nr:HlyC/CorC family transporter [Acidobacteriota bacterium]